MNIPVDVFDWTTSRAISGWSQLRYLVVTFLLEVKLKGNQG